MISNDLTRLIKSTKIKTIMISPVHVVGDRDNLSKAQKIFSDRRINHIPVVNDEGQLVGIISHKYLYKTLSPRKFMGNELEGSADMLMEGDSYYFKESLDRYILKNVMNKKPFFLGPENTVADVIKAMAGKRLGCVTIVDHSQKVIGVISDQEIFNFLAQYIV